MSKPTEQLCKNTLMKDMQKNHGKGRIGAPKTMVSTEPQCLQEVGRKEETKDSIRRDG